MTPDPAREFEAYRTQVYGWAYRLLGRHQDALDVGQDVFLRWLRDRGRHAPEHPRGWLRRVTINRAIDLLRARRSAVSTDRLAACGVTSAPSGAEQAELRAAVAAAFSDLSSMQRVVLIAKVHDGESFAEIAATHGIAVPTAKTHYVRALRAVRDRLARDWAPDDEGAMS